MRINSAINCVIFAIQIVGLVNECTHEFWCSQITRLMGIQYYRIVFREFIGTTLRFMSNFTHVTFSLSRLSLIGKDHGRLIILVSEEWKIKTVIALTLILSMLLSVVKLFRYTPVSIFVDDYSVYQAPVFQDESFKFSNLLATSSDHEKLLIRVYSVFNCISDVANYPMFLVFNLIVDVKMVFRLKKTFANKLLNSISNSMSEKKKREMENSINRAILFVILNATITLALKVPVLVNSIMEFAFSEYLFTKSKDEPLLELKMRKNGNILHYMAEDLNFFEFFDSFSNLLYLISLALTFVFYFKFDKNFNSSFQLLFFKRKFSLLFLNKIKELGLQFKHDPTNKNFNKFQDVY